MTWKGAPCGRTGSDGPSHHGVRDLAILQACLASPLPPLDSVRLAEEFGDA
ncbi:hypothetical protein C8K38_11258 [Rhodococcus sp. OK611]|uniref:hypothetical protein n=1 Tax=unclassified Rhodococcus (in: high G+C Gram-positive bacteria) TaxID=192944 RepID=UPI000BD5174C|nr:MULTISPECIES: hypothetical protein [unclassified Rhodococcus (in: high G+C Gram-positive bacteria)]PTR41175.1 hypothetical protein C8K38_11258 [Rhodococcus sp. OK611]SNX91997.1 hypothetical protein SAMN05447004_11258 [Rhodococcus sp. OK270]